MYNDIKQFVLTYELWSLVDSSYTENYYIEYADGEFLRHSNLNGETIDLTQELLTHTAIPVDLSPDLKPDWLK